MVQTDKGANIDLLTLNGSSAAGGMVRSLSIISIQEFPVLEPDIPFAIELKIRHFLVHAHPSPRQVLLHPRPGCAPIAQGTDYVANDELFSVKCRSPGPPMMSVICRNRQPRLD